MSGGISATTMMAAAAAAAVTYAATQKGPKLPGIADPLKPPQLTKAPDERAARAGNDGAAALAGPAATMLSGLNGVAPGGLNLGKSTLLGQ